MLGNLRNQEEDVNSYSFTKVVWKGLVPRKVEIFAWFVIIGSLNTKDKLYKFGIIQQDQVLCTLCNNLVESNGHLFFTCDYAWYLWCYWL